MPELITLRKRKTTKFYQVDLRIIELPSLSWGAKGLWTYLISRPDGWTVSRADILARSTEGERAVRTLVKELQSVGLIEITRVRDPITKMFIGTQWTVCEDVDAIGDGSSTIQKPQVDEPHVQNAHVGSARVENVHGSKGTSLTNYHLKNNQSTKNQEIKRSRSSVDDPAQGFGYSLFDDVGEEIGGPSPRPNTPPTQPQTQVAKTPPQVPAAPSPGFARRSRKKIDYNDPRFNAFWEIYPNKDAKQAAFDAWRKINPSDGLYEAIMKALADRVAGDSKWITEPEFIPHASTYLNKSRWTDNQWRLRQAKAPAPGAPMTQGPMNQKQQNLMNLEISRQRHMEKQRQAEARAQNQIQIQGGAQNVYDI